MRQQKSDVFKKAIAWFIALVMALTCGAMNFTVVKAVEAQDQQEKGEAVSEPEPGEYKDGEVLVMFTEQDEMDKQDVSNELSLQSESEDAFKGFQVKEVWSFETADEEADEDSAQLNGSEAQTGSEEDYANVALLDTGGISVDKAIEMLEEDDSIKYAEPNFKLHATAVSGADDPYIDRQWGLGDVNVDQIWGKARNTDYGVVAVVDTGVDFTHEDLKDNIWSNPYISKGLKGEHGFNFINGSKEPMDDNGHGSHCAGIINAAGNNGKGICGIAGADGNGGTRSNLDIMALKILDDEGSGYGAEEVAAYNYINRAQKMGVNIVAINNSYGGGEYSNIMEELITIVGERGAISVMAAGNDGMDIGRYYEEMEEKLYPVEYESNYKIVVAASKYNPSGSDDLASFSNYNRDMVDLAAPGTDILSTVSYDCYNPELYESGSGINNEAFTDAVEPEDFTEVSEGLELSECSGINGSDTGIRFTVSKADKDIYAACIPYSLDKTDFEEPPYASMLVRAEKTPDGGLFGAAYFEIFDTSADVTLEELTVKRANEQEMVYSAIGGSADYWVHLNTRCCTTADGDLETDMAGADRKLWIVMEDPVEGSYDVCVDSIGASNADMKTSFGKYDYYSGTSMACPMVTGATALVNQIHKKEKDYDPMDVVGEITSSARTSSILEKKTVSGGTLDFTRSSSNKALRISDVLAGKGLITIKGTGFTNFDNLTVKFGSQKLDPETYTIDKNSIVITDKKCKWINDVVNIKVTGKTGDYSKTAEKKNVYLANDKNSFSKPKSMDSGTTSVATNGKLMYTTSSSEDSIFKMYPKSGTDQEEIVQVTKGNLKSWFESYPNSKEKLGDYDFNFSDDLVYVNNRLYTIGNYVEIGDNFSGSDDAWMHAVSDEDDDEDEDMSREKDRFEYFKESVLLRANLRTGGISKIKLHKDLKDIEDYTLAAYNGNLYVMGGFRYKVKEDKNGKPKLTGSFNRNVYVFSPTENKWTKKKGVFPADRAGGRAIQTGNRLVYTLGYGDDSALKNIVFNGSKWTVKSAELKPYVEPTVVTRAGKTYDSYSCGIGICKGGIVYSGLNVKNYGDTFTYNVSGDKFRDTGFSLRPFVPETTDARATAIGSRVYSFTDEDGEDSLSYAKAISHGLMKVTTKKKGKGSITKTKYYIPGSKARVKIKAKKGYYISSVSVAGKNKKYSKKKSTRTLMVSKALVKNVTVKAYFKKR